jgi:hypothetical protein
MSARKPDPIIAAWIRLQAAEKADSASYNELDKAEAVAQADSGFNPLRPRVRVAGNDCITMADVRRSAKELPAAKAKEAIEAMRTALADWKRERRKAGLAPYDAAANRARREWRAAMQAMADTRATTTLGVVTKLRLIQVELRDGKTNYGESILASAIADLFRIEGRRK